MIVKKLIIADPNAALVEPLADHFRARGVEVKTAYDALTVLSAMLGHYLARSGKRWTKVLTLVLLAGLMIPPQVILIPITDVLRVTHRQSVKDLMQVGRDLEKVVLSRAIGKHIWRKIIVHKRRTIVFD